MWRPRIYGPPPVGPVEARLPRDTGAIPPDEISRVLSWIRSQPQVWTGPVDKLAHGAAEILDMHATPAVVRRLSTFYGASREVVAWQIANGTKRQLPSQALTYLRSLVSEAWRF